VSFYSQSLSACQRNYSTYERELFAVVKACEAFRVFLLGKAFNLRTDHRALCGLFSSTLQTSNRVVKWVMRLQPFKFTIQIIKGKDNIVADALSRIPWKVETSANSDEDLENDNYNLILYEDSETFNETENFNNSLEMLLGVERPIALARVVEEQKIDSSLNKFRYWLARETNPTKDELASESPFVRALGQQFEFCTVENDTLAIRENLPETRFRIIVPPSLIEDVIMAAHEGLGTSHEGWRKPS